MTKVREDLPGLLRYLCGSDGDDRNDLMQVIENFGIRFSNMDLVIFLDWLESLINTLYMQYNGSLEGKSFDELGQLVEATFYPAPPTQGLESLSLEELLALGKGDVDVQLISTPRQVVVLLSRQGQWTLGIYYDVQLERYSGFGISS